MSTLAQYVSDLARTAPGSRDLAPVLDAAVLVVDRIPVGELTAAWWEIEPGGDLRLAAGTGFTDLEAGRTVVDGVTSHAARVRAADARTAFEPGCGFAGQCIGLELAGELVVSGVGVPVRSYGRVVGALGAYSRTGAEVDARGAAVLQEVADAVGGVAEHACVDGQHAYLSGHDLATGLPGRDVLVERLTRALAAVPAGEAVAVALCQVDDFAPLHDAIGDTRALLVLATVAARLQEVACGGVVARTGDDEFAIVVPGAGNDRCAARVATRAIRAMEGPIATSGGRVAVSLSVGMAAGSAADTAGGVLASARAALHRARGRGRGQWVRTSGQDYAEPVARLPRRAPWPGRWASA